MSPGPPQPAASGDWPALSRPAICSSYWIARPAGRGGGRSGRSHRKARMEPILHNLDQARRDLFPREQRLDELVTEQLHDTDRIRVRDGDKRAFRGDKAVRL